MNKEKQIEEMAEDKQWQRRDNYCLRIQKALQYKGTADNEDVPSILVDFENEIRKEILPEDSVVLSRKEYQKDFSNQFNKGYKIGYKETAEKIFNTVIYRILALNFETNNKDYDNGFFDAQKEILRRIDDIAKESGVNLGE